jgi:hypothetical protein
MERRKQGKAGENLSSSRLSPQARINFQRSEPDDLDLLEIRVLRVEHEVALQRHRAGRDAEHAGVVCRKLIVVAFRNDSPLVGGLSK